jgi:hypothetical protein
MLAPGLSLEQTVSHAILNFERLARPRGGSLSKNRASAGYGSPAAVAMQPRTWLPAALRSCTAR